MFTTSNFEPKIRATSFPPQVLSLGGTGTGKTLTIADKLSRGMGKEYVPDFIVFSAKTSANQTQDLIDGKLDKRFVHCVQSILIRYFCVYNS